MSETPAPHSVARVEAPPRVESRPPRREVIRSLNRTLDGVPGVFPGYREEMAPLWDRLKRGDNLTPEERRNAIGYHVTMEGIKNITGREPQPGEPSWPDNLATDEWTNEYKDQNGNLIGKQREGLRIKHMVDWLDGKIEQARADGRATDEFMLEVSKKDLVGSSATYAELHSSPGSLDIETRKRQEAGALIHASQETDEFGNKVRDSQIPQDDETNRAAHEREDWSFAEAELDGRKGEPGGALELVVPPPKSPEPPKLTNVPKLRVDETLPTKRVEVRGSDGLPPIYVGGNSEDRSGQTVDMGGGEVVVPPAEIVRTGVDVSPRSIPENLQGPGAPEYAPYSAEGDRSSEFGVGARPTSEEIRSGRMGEGPPPYNASTAEGSRENAGFGVGDLPPGPKTGEYDDSADSISDEDRIGRPPSQIAEDSTDFPDNSSWLPPRSDKSSGEVRGWAETRTDEGTEGKEAVVKAEGVRAGRLAKLKGLADSLWKRVRTNNQRVATDDDWLRSRVEPDLDPRTPRKGIGKWIALALVVAAVTATCVKPPEPGAGSKAEPFPGSQYGLNPPTELVGTPPPPPDYNPELPARPPVAEVVKPSKTYDTKVEDFSKITGPQYVDGLAKDQLAQAVDPAYAKEVEDARAENRVVDPALGGAQERMDKMTADLIAQYGEARGTAIANELMRRYSEAVTDVVNSRNQGVARVENGEIKFTGPPGNLTLPDARTEGGKIYADVLGRIANEPVAPVLPSVTVNQGVGNNGQ